MTLEQAVALFDAACPNTAPLALKVRWISEVDALFAASLTSRADVSFDESECRRQLDCRDLAHSRDFRRDNLLPCRIDKFRRAAEVFDKSVGEIDCA